MYVLGLYEGISKNGKKYYLLKISVFGVSKNIFLFENEYKHLKQTLENN